MLRIRLEVVQETLQDFELAAEEKYWEGAALLSAGHPAGGIYVLGYAAEMILKHAGFRTQGHRPGTVVSALFGPARQWMRTRPPSIQPENYHSLWFWMQYLRGMRRHWGRPLPVELDWELVRRVRELYQLWWVGMRYRPDQADAHEAAAAYDNVTWLRANQVRFWS